MASSAERIAVLETKVENLDEKIDHLQGDINSNHQAILDTLKEMRDTSVAQHTDMANKIKELEGFKNKWVRWGMMALAFLAGAGWLGNSNLPTIVKFLGL
jgi:hypothetical protein